MTEDQLSKIPKLIRNCRLSEASGKEGMLMMPEGLIRLKGTGLDIAALIDGKRDLRAIAGELKKRYPSADGKTIEADVLEFIKMLREKRVLDLECQE